MIFATVGTQLPFDRLLSGLDQWAAAHPGLRIRAQTGQSRGGFRHLSCAPFLAAQAFQSTVAKASIIVSHAGMGTILTAAELGKPVVIMPRRADLGEHRNDHQNATAQEMQYLANVYVAEDAQALANCLDGLLRDGGADRTPCLPPHASPELLGAVSDFIWSR